MFEYDAEEKRYVARHHPFTSPMPKWIDGLENHLAEATAQAYDVVCNGYEIGGGSILIHDANVQRKVFQALSMTMEEAYEKFGFLLDALQFGAPPHGGIAWHDRLQCALSGRIDSRSLPSENQQCTMPDDRFSVLSAPQLNELHIRVVEAKQQVIPGLTAYLERVQTFRSHGKSIRGKPEAIQMSLALLLRRHLLIEDVPGMENDACSTGEIDFR